MKIIGITGGIGAGKSTVSREFEKLGAKVVDADKISRQVTTKDGCAYGEIVDYFGEDILFENGEINRKRLSELVFSDKEKLSVLNNITHKHIFKEMESQIKNANTDIVVLDVPLLFSSDFKIKCDLKIAVIADEKIRINRVIERDGLSENEISARIKNQISDAEYERLADICIYNNDLENTRKDVKKIYDRLREII